MLSSLYAGRSPPPSSLANPLPAPAPTVMDPLRHAGPAAPFPAAFPGRPTAAGAGELVGLVGAPGPVLSPLLSPTATEALLYNSALGAGLRSDPAGPGPMTSNLTLTSSAGVPLCGATPYDLQAYPYLPNAYGALDPRRKNATKESTNTLKAWLYEHKKNPYPTKGEKIMLAILTRMTLTQVSTWFANARRRLKKENKVTWPGSKDAEDGDEEIDVDDDDDDEHRAEQDDEDGDDDVFNHHQLVSEASALRGCHDNQPNETETEDKGFIDVVSHEPGETTTEEEEAGHGGRARSLQPPGIVPITPPPSPPEAASSPRTSIARTPPPRSPPSAASTSSPARSPHHSSPAPVQQPQQQQGQPSPQSSPGKKPSIWSVADMVNDHNKTECRAQSPAADQEPRGAGRPQDALSPSALHRQHQSLHHRLAVEPYLAMSQAGLGAWPAAQYPFRLYPRHQQQQQPVAGQAAATPLIPYWSHAHPHHHHHPHQHPATAAAGLRLSALHAGHLQGLKEGLPHSHPPPLPEQAALLGGLRVSSEPSPS